MVKLRWVSFLCRARVVFVYARRIFSAWALPIRLLWVGGLCLFLVPSARAAASSADVLDVSSAPTPTIVKAKKLEKWYQPLGRKVRPYKKYFVPVAAVVLLVVAVVTEAVRGQSQNQRKEGVDGDNNKTTTGRFNNTANSNISNTNNQRLETVQGKFNDDSLSEIKKMQHEEEGSQGEGENEQEQKRDNVNIEEEHEKKDVVSTTQTFEFQQQPQPELQNVNDEIMAENENDIQNDSPEPDDNVSIDNNNTQGGEEDELLFEINVLEDQEKKKVALQGLVVPPNLAPVALHNQEEQNEKSKQNEQLERGVDEKDTKGGKIDKKKNKTGHERTKTTSGGGGMISRLFGKKKAKNEQKTDNEEQKTIQEVRQEEMDEGGGVEQQENEVVLKENEVNNQNKQGAAAQEEKLFEPNNNNTQNELDIEELLLQEQAQVKQNNQNGHLEQKIEEKNEKQHNEVRVEAVQDKEAQQVQGDGIPDNNNGENKQEVGQQHLVNQVELKIVNNEEQENSEKNQNEQEVVQNGLPNKDVAKKEEKQNEENKEENEDKKDEEVEQKIEEDEEENEDGGQQEEVAVVNVDATNDNNGGWFFGLRNLLGGKSKEVNKQVKEKAGRLKLKDKEEKDVKLPDGRTLELQQKEVVAQPDNNNGDKKQQLEQPNQLKEQEPVKENEDKANKNENVAKKANKDAVQVEEKGKKQAELADKQQENKDKEEIKQDVQPAKEAEQENKHEEQKVEPNANAFDNNQNLLKDRVKGKGTAKLPDVNKKNEKQQKQEAIGRYQSIVTAIQADNKGEVEKVVAKWKQLDPTFKLAEAAYNKREDQWMQDQDPKGDPKLGRIIDYISGPGETYQYLKSQGCYFSKSGIFDIFAALEEVVSAIKEEVQVEQKEKQNEEKKEMAPKQPQAPQGLSKRTSALRKTFEENKQLMANFIPTFLEALCKELLAGMEGKTYNPLAKKEQEAYEPSKREAWKLNEVELNKLKETILPFNRLMSEFAENKALGKVSAALENKVLGKGKALGGLELDPYDQKFWQPFGTPVLVEAYDALQQALGITVKK